MFTLRLDKFRSGFLPARVRPALGDGYLMSDDQAWEHLADADLAHVGSRARVEHLDGFERWQRSINEYASFVLDS